MIELWRHIRNNYNSNRDFARKNNLSIHTVQNAIARNKHIVDEKNGDVYIKNSWEIRKNEA